MAETQTEELGLEEIVIKEEIDSIKEEFLPSSTVDDTWYYFYLSKCQKNKS